MSGQADPATRGQQRVARLVEAFEGIARTRMAGLPVVHPGLRVEAVGFALHQDPNAGDDGMLGVLVTPWCMNLVWLGLDGAYPPPDRTAPAATMERIRDLGPERFAFRVAHEAGIGPYEMCSLASPLFAFADQAAAVATARGVLDLLRPRVPAGGLTRPERRRFLLGRRPAPASSPR